MPGQETESELEQESEKEMETGNTIVRKGKSYCQKTKFGRFVSAEIVRNKKSKSGNENLSALSA